MHLIAEPEAFVVEEIPAYDACGEGEHLHVQVRKRDCTTARLIDALAAACGVPQRDIGYAGRKDRHGITTQALTIRGGRAEDLAQLQQHLPPGATAEILASSRHRNKLRPGHLRGNRFRLQIGGVDDAPGLQDSLQILAGRGILNIYGPQRYGRDGRNRSRAQAVADGSLTLPRNRQQRQYLADAAQAAVFDYIAHARQNQGLGSQAMAGDVIMLENGACFIAQADDLDEVNQRLAAGVCSCTAPLPGSQCMQAALSAQTQEEQWSREAGFAWDLFIDGGPFVSRGDRRRLFERFLEAPQLIAAQHAEEPHVLSFALGAGAYATSVLEQLGISVDSRGASQQPGPG